MPTVILRYHEIALKGGNRPFFESCLRNQLKRVFEDRKDFNSEHSEREGEAPRGFAEWRGRREPLLKEVRVCYERDHFWIEFEEEERAEVEKRLKWVFGVANFYFVNEVPVPFFVEGDACRIAAFECVMKEAIPLIQAARLALTPSGNDPRVMTFRVQVRRRDHGLPTTSMDLARGLSAFLLPKFEDFRVNLSCADITLYVDWFSDHVQLYVNKIPGAGGLPVGSSGKLVSLLSAGFDSPVAAWRMMRRGAKMVFAHFHSYPATRRESIDNVREIVQVLNRYQWDSKLYLFPLVEFQKEVLKNAPGQYRTLLYRRMMMRVAQRLSRFERAKGIVTGESLGQVASQTLDNLHTVDVLSEWPVYRPLIGTDKQEIIAEARIIETEPLSNRPYEDCCTLYVDRSPALSADPETLEAIEKNLDIAKFENLLWEKREMEKF